MTSPKAAKRRRLKARNRLALRVRDQVDRLVGEESHIPSVTEPRFRGTGLRQLPEYNQIDTRAREEDLVSGHAHNVVATRRLAPSLDEVEATPDANPDFDIHAGE